MTYCIKFKESYKFLNLKFDNEDHIDREGCNNYDDI